MSRILSCCRQPEFSEGSLSLSGEAGEWIESLSSSNVVAHVMRIETDTFGKRRLLALDLLRAIAALIVVVGHTNVLFPGYAGITFSMCVAFFFILSGFVLVHAYGDEIHAGRLSLWDFFVIRFARLYPLHILTAVVVGVLLFAFGRRAEITPIGILENLVVSQSLISGTWSLNAPAWSLGPEIWGSLLIFALCSRRPTTRAVLVAATAAVVLYVEIRSGFLMSYTGRYWIGLGCFVLGWAAHEGLFDAVANRIMPAVAWVLAAATFAATIFCPSQFSQSAIGDLCFYAPFTLVVVVLARVQMTGLFADVARTSGNISYGIYLWHWPLLIVFRPATIPGLTLFVALLIAISWISYLAFEKMAKKRIRKFLSSPRAMVRAEQA